MKTALLQIVNARDYCAEHCSYPDPPHGPGPGQAFDDWAADIAEAALKEPPDTAPERCRRIGELIQAYREHCTEDEYADVGEAWELLDGVEKIAKGAN